MSSLLRRLGPAEELMVWADPVSPINNCVAITLRGSLTPDTVTAALASLHTEHPLIGARIVRRGLHRVFVSDAPAITLVCEAVDEATWPRRVAEEMDTPFAAEAGPLIRARLFAHSPTHHTLLLVLHHAICDGRVALHLTHTLLHRLATPHPVPTRRPVPPDISTCLPADARGWSGFRRMQQASRALLDDLKQAATRWPLADTTPLDQRHKILKWHTFPTDVSTRFLQRIRNMGATEQSAMSAIAAAALGRVLGLQGEVMLATALDLSRRLALPAAEAVCIATSALTTRVAIAPDDDIWPATKALKTALRRCFAAQQHLYLTPPSLALNAGIARWLGIGPGGPRRLAKLAERMSAHTLSHTSMGTLALPTSLAGLQVEQVVFLAGYTTHAPLVSLAQRFDGRLCWSLGGFREQFGEERLQAVLQEIVRRVETIAGEAP